MGKLVKTLLYPVMTKEWHAEVFLHLLSLLQFFSQFTGLFTVTPGLLRFTFIQESEILLEAARPHCSPTQNLRWFPIALGVKSKVLAVAYKAIYSQLRYFSDFISLLRQGQPG